MKQKVVRVRRNSPIVSVLTYPVWHTFNRARVEESRYPFVLCSLGAGPEPEPCFVLTTLGILHRWTGLTLDVYR